MADNATGSGPESSRERQGAVVVGDQSYVRWTKQLATGLGVSDRVEWLGSRSDLPQVMKAAAAVILPTHFEGFGVVLAEAMAIGTPVIATPAGGILDLILPGVTGYFFDVEIRRGWRIVFST